MNLVDVYFYDDTEVREGWDKDTIEFIIQNESKIRSFIQGRLKEYRKSNCKDVVDDIYSDLINNAFKYSDYDVSRAQKGDKIVGLEGYVNSLIKNSVKRWNSVRGRDSKFSNSTLHKGTDDEDLSLFDIVEAVESRDSFNFVNLEDFRATLEHLSHNRYILGIDIIELSYVYLRIVAYEHKRDNYAWLLEALDLSFKHLKVIKGIGKIVNIVGEIISDVITFEDIEKPLAEVRRYVYMADRIDEAFRYCSDAVSIDTDNGFIVE